MVTLVLSVAAIGLGVVLTTGIPNPFKTPVAGQAPPMLVRGLETGLMPAMDEGAFVFDYLAPTGTPLKRTEEMVREIEKILSKNPDVQAYVRRTGAELGIFATQTNRGDIQVILRPAENDPISLVSKRVRPKLEDVEEEVKKLGMTPEEGKEYVRKRYRRRPLRAVMDEVEEEARERFSETSTEDRNGAGHGGRA